MLKRHSMILKSFSVGAIIQNQDQVVRKKRVWNLKEEIANVIKNGMDLGCEFNGRKKELRELMAMRDDEKDNRFHELVRWGGGGLLSGNDSGTAARTCTSSSSPTSRAAAFSSDVVPRPVAHPKQQPRSPSGLRCFSYGDVKHIQSECKKVVFVEPEDSQEELVENIGVEPIFDEEEKVQEEDVGVGEEPQFDVVETMEEDLVDSDTGALEQRLCAEGQQFEEEDEAETRDELQFDGEEMFTEDLVEGDVGPLLMVRPAVITIIVDVKPEIDEVECYSAPKFDKEVVLGRDDTAEVQGTTMVFLDRASATSMWYIVSSKGLLIDESKIEVKIKYWPQP
ncbi:hypothetical protein LWI28_006506 [Acer negundo]|uniref:Uncharacterized protein n=1 Tax=Acer negundo TaxID=4023 RepID=A0AAD5NXH8_ACENE|nr:hypothetical protein LWI28_006506 [Acer negundo]